jgi:prepilin-type N-terminal cleavage/methylation domain-containing protein
MNVFPQGARPHRLMAGFTLIEIMVAIAIIALVLTIGIPFVRMAIDNGKGMTKALKDIQEACSHARAIAILQQTTSELRIRPGDGVFEVGAGSGMASADRAYGRSSGSGGESGKGFNARLPEGIRIEGLGVNGEDWTEDEVARVRFYANGTCDAMSVVLLSDENERRNIWLEVVTGLPEVETDPQKFRVR